MPHVATGAGVVDAALVGFAVIDAALAKQTPPGSTTQQAVARSSCSTRVLRRLCTAKHDRRRVITAATSEDAMLNTIVYWGLSPSRLLYVML